MMKGVLFLPLHNSVDDVDYRKTIERTIEGYRELVNIIETPTIPKPI